MKRFVVGFTWKIPPNPNLAEPERARVKELITEGKMEQMFLASDRSRGWLIMLGDSENGVLESVKTLPFYPYMGLETTQVLSQYP